MEETPQPPVEPNQDQQTEETPQVVVGHNTKKWTVTRPLGVLFAVLFAAIGGYFLYASFAAPPKKPASQTAQPLSFTQNWTNDPGKYLANYQCFGVDDDATWTGNGTLAPGASYTFNPSYPTCAQSEIPIIAMHVNWSGSTNVKVETTNPFTPAFVDNNTNGPFHINVHEVAPVTADANGTQQANLCMLTNANMTQYANGTFASSAPMDYTKAKPVNWSVTITNTGTSTATISASGFERDGWPTYLYPVCVRADADGDHWNDALEMITENLSEAASGAADAHTAYQGTNYLSGSGSATANDEVDFSPADFNDDGVIDQTDVNTVSSYVGQGDGISIDQLSPNNNEPGAIANEYKVWRRYDIDGDGNVTQHDVDWVKALVDQPVPMKTDILDPYAVIKTSDTVPANYSGYYLYAYAVDNDMITHVDFYAGTKLICTNWGYGADQYLTAKADHNFFGCGWSTPRSSGTSTQLTVKAYDNAGHSYSTTKTVTTQ